MSKNYNYTNMLNYYGFNGNTSLETYPEERRNWRKTIKQHTDDAMGITDEQIANGDNMTKRLDEAHEDINEKIATSESNVKTHVTEAKNEIKSHVTDAKNEIKSHVTTAKESVESKISQVKQDTANIVEWTRTHYWWNGN